MFPLEFEQFLAVFGGIFAFGLVFALLIAVFYLVCSWKIYKKLGEPGFTSIIPFYNTYLLCKHTWGNGWVMLAMYLPTFITGLFDMVVLAAIASAFVSIINYMTIWKLYRGFGKSTLFCVLGLFFTPITHAICAFDNSEYYGF